MREVRLRRASQEAAAEGRTRTRAEPRGEDGNGPASLLPQSLPIGNRKKLPLPLLRATTPMQRATGTKSRDNENLLHGTARPGKKENGIQAVRRKRLFLLDALHSGLSLLLLVLRVRRRRDGGCRRVLDRLDLATNRDVIVAGCKGKGGGKDQRRSISWNWGSTRRIGIVRPAVSSARTSPPPTKGNPKPRFIEVKDSRASTAVALVLASSVRYVELYSGRAQFDTLNAPTHPPSIRSSPVLLVSVHCWKGGERTHLLPSLPRRYQRSRTLPTREACSRGCSCRGWV